MMKKMMDQELVAYLRKILPAASIGDRTYERPMSWDQAEQLLEILARTERNRDMWKAQCERQAQQLTRVHARTDPLTAFDTLPDDFETN